MKNANSKSNTQICIHQQFQFYRTSRHPNIFLKCIKTRSSLNIFSKLILCNELCVDSETHYSALIRPNVSEQ